MSAVCEYTAATNTVMHTAATGKNMNKTNGEKATNECSDTQIKFIMDSGATDHMANKEKYFADLNEIDDINISVAKKNESICAQHKGDIHVKTTSNGDREKKTMKDVLFVKDLNCNFMATVLFLRVTQLWYR